MGDEWSTPLDLIFKKEYAVDGELDVAEYIMLVKADAPALRRPGLLICFDRDVYYFEEKFRERILQKVEVWKKTIFTLQDNRDESYEWGNLRNSERPPPPQKCQYSALWIGLETMHSYIHCVQNWNELMTAMFRISQDIRELYE